jgi:competence protein ComEA
MRNTLRAFALMVLVVTTVTYAEPVALQSSQPTVHAQPAGDLLDINTATPQQLNALPGFGPAYTRRVIEGRPYTAKNQLVTRGVLPKSAYELVSSRIIAHRVAR